ncbi:ABC transporter permease [Fodinicola acaciae]|uniref:ABC transporter permease n=1 Tax=Fodinicola acaciae TaxID=2681555 RepID=UPI0013D64DC6|nr:ABC transporter permease [Fodinicola acaciae]
MAGTGTGSGTTATVAATPTGGERWKRVLSTLGSLQGYVGLALVLILGIATKGDVFLSQANITNAVGAFASRGILAVGETLVILAAGIDLSVGSMLGLASLVSALLLVNADMPPWVILPVCTVAGAAMGFCNGAGATWLRIQPFVMTLATLSVFRGLDRQISNNVSVGTQVAGPTGKLSEHADQFQLFGTPGHNLFTGVLGAGVYYPVLAFVITCVVFQLILSKTTFGRHIYAVGGNETAARLSGINVDRVKIGVFTICGLLAGFAGPIDAAYSASADPLAGSGYELDVIAAVVIGGAALAGGRGSIVGTFVGVLILTLLDNVLGLNAVSDNLQLIIKGLIVVVAVVLQRPDLISSFAAFLRRTFGRTTASAPSGQTTGSKS